MANGRPVVGSKTATRGWTLVRACLLIVPMSIIVPLLLITCLAAGLSLTVSGFVAAFVVLLALPCATRLLPARLTYDRAGHRFLFALWVALSLFVSFRVTTMSIFMLDAQKVQYAVNSTIHTLWTVSNPETKSRHTIVSPRARLLSTSRRRMSKTYTGATTILRLCKRARPSARRSVTRLR